MCNNGTCSLVSGVPVCACLNNFTGPDCSIPPSGCPLPKLTGRCPDRLRGKTFDAVYTEPLNFNSGVNSVPYVNGAFISRSYSTRFRVIAGDLALDGSMAVSGPPLRSRSLVPSDSRPPCHAQLTLIYNSEAPRQVRMTCNGGLAANGVFYVDLEWPNAVNGTTLVSRGALALSSTMFNPYNRNYYILTMTPFADPISYGPRCYRALIAGDLNSLDTPVNTSAEAVILAERCTVSTLAAACPAPLLGGFFSGWSMFARAFTMQTLADGSFSLWMGASALCRRPPARPLARPPARSPARPRLPPPLIAYANCAAQWGTSETVTGRLRCSSSFANVTNQVDLLLSNGDVVRGLLAFNFGPQGLIRLGERSARRRSVGRPAGRTRVPILAVAQCSPTPLCPVAPAPARWRSPPRRSSRRSTSRTCWR